VPTPVSHPSIATHAASTSTVSVVVCTYSQRRWEALLAAVASVASQTHPPLETIVVIDHNSDLFDRAQATLQGACVVENDGENGLSAARNTGLKVARGEIVAFLDDDAIADNTWLKELVSAYEDPNVIGAGGVARPRWIDGGPPRWLPCEFYWTVGCSYRGLPTQTAPVRNPIGANISFRRTVFGQTEGFVSGIGRVGRTPLGCEETELSIRALSDRKRQLEHLLGRGVETFTYPYGAYDRRVREAVIADGFPSAVAVKNALFHRGDDPWAIARWTVRSTSRAQQIARILDGRGAPCAWRHERLRTRGCRTVRKVRRTLGRGVGSRR
jgi:glycosyltransferase involved in cell wall biosynthesis